MWRSGGCDVIKWRSGGCDVIMWCSGSCDVIMWRSGGCDVIKWRSGSCDVIMWRSGSGVGDDKSSPSQAQQVAPLTSTPVKQSPAEAAAAAAAAVSCEEAFVDLVASSRQLQHLALIYSTLIKGKPMTQYWKNLGFFKNQPSGFHWVSSFGDSTHFFKNPIWWV